MYVCGAEVDAEAPENGDPDACGDKLLDAETRDRMPKNLKLRWRITWHAPARAAVITVHVTLPKLIPVRMRDIFRNCWETSLALSVLPM